MITYNRLIEISKALQPAYKDFKSFHTTFVIKSGKIHVIGINNPKTSPRNLKFNYYDSTLAGTHSELSAVIKLGLEICDKYTFFNIRIDKNKIVRMSKPCTGCQSMFKQVGFKHFYYSINETEFGVWE